MDRDDDKDKPKGKPKERRKDEQTNQRRRDERPKLSRENLPLAQFSLSEKQELVENAVFGERNESIAARMTPQVFGTFREADKHTLARDIVKDVAKLYRGEAPAVRFEDNISSGLHRLDSDPRAQPVIKLARSDIQTFEKFAAEIWKAALEAFRLHTSVGNEHPKK